MRWMRTANRLGMWALIVLPTLWSGRDNLREHLGYGVGQPWTSAWDIVSGWGLWLVGVFIWIAIVTGVSGWIDQKLGAP
ncbi:MAG: hypothetical protein DMD89_37605 [Candidatus Rokuibacteriota bacterium]|nr:MAG: hypothetical protein DMD89_37605 [Candidatus Rokubacteria bacterium]